MTELIVGTIFDGTLAVKEVLLQLIYVLPLYVSSQSFTFKLVEFGVLSARLSGTVQLLLVPIPVPIVFQPPEPI